eukprot:3298890-Rhodomonas_salina.1
MILSLFSSPPARDETVLLLPVQGQCVSSRPDCLGPSPLVRDLLSVGNERRLYQTAHPSLNVSHNGSPHEPTQTHPVSSVATPTLRKDRMGDSDGLRHSLSRGEHCMPRPFSPIRKNDSSSSSASRVLHCGVCAML